MHDYKNKGKWTDIQVHLTNNCELMCRHCYTDSKPSFRIWLDENKFLNILEFAQSVPNCIVRLIGGEVLTKELEIKRYMEIAKHFNVPLILSTTGYYSNAFISKEINPNIFKEIILSCYGIVLQHDLFTRVQDSFSNFLALVNYFNSTSRNFELTVNTVLVKQNQDNFIEFLLYLKKIGIDEIKILSLSPIGKINNHSAWNNLEVEKDIKKRIYDNVYKTVNLGIFGNVRVIIENPFFTRPPKKCKIAKRSMVTIDHLGNVFPCHLLINEKDYSLGNINEMPLDKIAKRKFHITYDGYNCLAYKEIYLNGMQAGCPMSLELINQS